MLGNITATLESEGILNNTYIFYMVMSHLHNDVTWRGGGGGGGKLL